MVDEPIANRTFETLDDLEEILFHRCQSLLQQDLIQGLVFIGGLKSELNQSYLPNISWHRRSG